MIGENFRLDCQARLLVAQKLREILGPTTPIVIVSGDTSMEVINALPHVGATYFFSKPLNAASATAWLAEREQPGLQLPGEYKAVAPAAAAPPGCGSGVATPPAGRPY